MKTSCSAIDRWVANEVVERRYYIDRIRLQVNDLSARDQIVQIIRNAPQSVEVKITPGFQKSSRRSRKTVSPIAVKWTVELLLPPSALLAEMADCLMQSHYTMSWLEIAFDFKLLTRVDAINGLEFLAEMIVVPSIAGAPTFSDREVRGTDEGDETSHRSVFFGTYDDKRMFKMYVPAGDRKIFGETSVHTEFLLKGAEEIRRNGLFTLVDLVELDFPRWYRDRVRACGLDKKAIGAALRRGQSKDAASDRQCQKDSEREFRAGRAKAHMLHHYESRGLRDGLVKCSDKWLDGPVW